VRYSRAIAGSALGSARNTPSAAGLTAGLARRTSPSPRRRAPPRGRGDRLEAAEPRGSTLGPSIRRGMRKRLDRSGSGTDGVKQHAVARRQADEVAQQGADDVDRARRGRLTRVRRCRTIATKRGARAEHVDRVLEERTTVGSATSRQELAERQREQAAWTRS